MSISDEELKHIAKLASLELNDEEFNTLRNDLEQIISYVEKLSDVSTEEIKPTYHVHHSSNVFREDIVEESLSVEEATKNSAESSNGSFRVPRII